MATISRRSANSSRVSYLCAVSLLAILGAAAGCRRNPVKIDRGPRIGIDPDAGPSTPAVVLEAAPPIPKPPAFFQFPPPPEGNPSTPERVQLGQLLFFDTRLSADESLACEGCHYTDKAYTSGRKVDQKVQGPLNVRNAPPMTNLAFHREFYWDGRKKTLEETVAAEWANQLNAKGKEAEIATKLNQSSTYRAHFQRAFSQDATQENIPQAIAAFLRVLTTGDAPWDRYEKGDKTAVSAEAVRGFEVFRTAGCASCHTPPLYSDLQYHNIGIGWQQPKGQEDGRDKGRMDATKDPKDEGKFKTPSLRDVTLTRPYFHDGSVSELKDAIALMVAGGIKSKDNPNFDKNLKPAKLSPADLAALGAFIESLTGKLSYPAAPSSIQ